MPDKRVFPCGCEVTAYLNRSDMSASVKRKVGEDSTACINLTACCEDPKTLCPYVEEVTRHMDTERRKLDEVHGGGGKFKLLAETIDGTTEDVTDEVFLNSEARDTMLKLTETPIGETVSMECGCEVWLNPTTDEHKERGFQVSDSPSAKYTMHLRPCRDECEHAKRIQEEAERIDKKILQLRGVKDKKARFMASREAAGLKDAAYRSGKTWPKVLMGDGTPLRPYSPDIDLWLTEEGCKLVREVALEGGRNPDSMGGVRFALNEIGDLITKGNFKTEAWAVLTKHPLFSRVFKRWNEEELHGILHRIDTAEDVLFEKLMTEFRLVADPMVHLKDEFVIDKVALSEPASRWIIFEHMKSAVPYLWTNEIRMAVTAQKVPPHVIGPDTLPHPHMWWTFETDAVPHPDSPDQDMGQGVLARHVPGRGIEMTLLYKSITHRLQTPEGDAACISVGHVRIPYGARYPEDFPKAQATSLNGFLACCAFLKSPYIGTEMRKVSRELRRAIDKEAEDKLSKKERKRRRHYRGPKPSDRLPAVHFIDLRRIHPKGKPGHREPTKEREFRWLVSGHFRRQWYATTQSHKVIWIHPFMKGPDDKPFKPPVFRVRR